MTVYDLKHHSARKHVHFFLETQGSLYHLLRPRSMSHLNHLVIAVIAYDNLRQQI